MEVKIKTNYFPLNNDSNNNISYRMCKPRELTHRGQCRNRKAELDWDHAFDLDQVHLYTTQNDIDDHSLASIHSSYDRSLSSF